MSKVIYRYNPDTDIYYGNLKVSDSYEPQAGESLLPVPEGLFEPIKHIVDDEGREGWLGTPKEEWEKANPGTPAKPDPSRQVIMSQQSDITQLQKMVMGQQSTMTQMQKMVMTQQAEITQLKKGAN